MTQPTVEAVFTGVASYDDLDVPGQALVRAAWETRDTIRLAALNFTLMCPDCGLAYAAAVGLRRAHFTHLTHLDPSGPRRTLPMK